jgi:type I restriction enzyme R subunit
MITGINNEDRLVQQTFADHLKNVLGWESVYTFNNETFGPDGTLGRSSEREVVLVRDLRAAIQRLNPSLPPVAVEQAIQALTRFDSARSLVQHNQEFYGFLKHGVPVEYRNEQGERRQEKARVIDFRESDNNRYLAVRELKIQGLRAPHYNRRADLVCFVNGLPLVFIELKAVYRNIRAAFDDNLTDYLHENSIAQAFYHNAFLIVSNGDRARYGSVTTKWDHFAEWKRSDEKDVGRVEAETLLDGMLAKKPLLDIVQNFILFDESRIGGVRKIVARNHQVLGVNLAVESVKYQEALKRRIPRQERMIHGLASVEQQTLTGEATGQMMDLPLLQRAHEDLGRLGVFWHTQGSGKSYSMAFFVEKVRTVVPGNFTFLVMTDRDDLDSQIFKTFVGCHVADEKTPRAASGQDLKALLAENSRFIFTLIHKFNQTVTEPYSDRDDIIVISDEAHRTQSGKFARNMRRALPNAAFIGFTGTPLFKNDQLTKRIFGNYVSRYDFKRSEEDQSTVKLIYENRGEKLGLAREDLNERIAEKIEEAELDPDQQAKLERLLGRDYGIITADDRLDKITCARMHQRILPLWQRKQELIAQDMADIRAALESEADPDEREKLETRLARADAQREWMKNTLIEIIISEAQNEVKDFAEWDFDIIPHREIMKRGFETPDGKRTDPETAFKDPAHPFRVAIVCAMWLTGFDVECLSTLYIDKPMKAHSLMQAIARANRVYPGKEYGVIVDYNGMLKSLRAALAQYAVGDDDPNGLEGEIIAPIAEVLGALKQAVEVTEDHLKGLGFDPGVLKGAKGFTRIAALRDAVEALSASDEAKRRFEIMAKIVFARFRALLIEPSAFAYAERHDNIEAIFKKLQERRDGANITSLLKELHKIVNEAIQTQGEGEDHAEAVQIDLSQIDFEKLKAEFGSQVQRPNTTLQDIRAIVEQKLAAMIAANPARMDYEARYQAIIAAYNTDKDRATIEETFVRLLALVESLDEEQQRAAREGLSEPELALFDLLFQESITKTERQTLKLASRSLLDSLTELFADMPHWTRNAQTQAEVQTSILDRLYLDLPHPPFTDEETQTLAHKIYDFVWSQSRELSPSAI